MKDYFHTILKWMDHNRGQVVGVLLPVIFCITIFAGCLESKTHSILAPGEKISRAEFANEVFLIEKNLEKKRLSAERYIADYNVEAKSSQDQVTAGFDNLDAQDLRNAKLFEAVGGFATAVIDTGITPTSIVQILLMLGSVGWGIGNKADNVRKDAEIVKRDVKIKELIVQPSG